MAADQPTEPLECDIHLVRAGAAQSPHSFLSSPLCLLSPPSTGTPPPTSQLRAAPSEGAELRQMAADRESEGESRVKIKIRDQRREKTQQESEAWDPGSW